MKGSGVGGSVQGSRVLNAVPLQNAVLCAECDVVSDSPSDTCLICGSRSLFNIARVFGGKLPKERANLIAKDIIEVTPRESVLIFPQPHKPRRRATAGSRQLTVLPLEDEDNEINERESGMLVGPRSH